MNAFALLLAALSSQEAPPLRVMSYNVRYGTAPDGENHWDKRKELCAARAVEFAPDLLGLQEALHFQNAYFLEKLGPYGKIGVSRQDGKEQGEFTTIFYRKERFEELESGTFWLSETPDVPGSKSWDSMFPRVASWARLRDLKAGGRKLLFVNTHFDHRGVQARIEAAKILRDFVSKRGGPAIVSGDFNSGPGSAPYTSLLEAKLSDTLLALHPEPAEGTAHPFTGRPVTPRIDWILCSPAFDVKEAGVDRRATEGRYPSDHFPVTAVVAWK